ncbi:MAG: 50S ribosomal protein L6 [Candidatus Nanoarchaeia archaeon]|nr:50S ribosomal protein L6 [Candidatus Nanoarchaeia archaeon]MDD5741726.1 50S ribosomal protein L6 [Candidatus Nanoarchaeia archaeon]
MKTKSRDNNEKNKRPDLKEEIEMPNGMTANIEEHTLIIKKNSVESRRELNQLVAVRVELNKIILEAKKSTKKEKRVFGSFVAHIKNIIRGLNERFKYRLQAASVHFPMTLSIDKEKNELLVKNFLGEKTDRRIKLVKGAEVKISKDIIEIESENKELAGQCAANIEKGTKVRNKDRRIYQDGIYIIEKPGRNLLQK